MIQGIVKILMYDKMAATQNTSFVVKTFTFQSRLKS